MKAKSVNVRGHEAWRERINLPLTLFRTFDHIPYCSTENGIINGFIIL